MKSTVFSRQSVVLIAITSLLASPVAFAQELTGELGSASATTTISGKQLPAPAP